MSRTTHGNDVSVAYLRVELGSYQMGGGVFSVFNKYVALMRDDKGAGLVEWGLLVVLVAVVAMVAVTASGEALSDTYSEISSTLAEAGS